MKRKLTVIILLMAIPFIKVSAQCAAISNIYSFTVNGKSYEIVKEMKSWTDAAACAQQRGGHLLYINSKAENDSIYNRIIQGAAISNSYTSVGDGGGASYLWIGATDKSTEGTWKWDGTNSGSGTTFWMGQGAAGAGGGYVVNSLYTNWGGTSTGTPNEPDDYASIQDCAGIALTEWPLGAPVSSRYGNASEWNDLDGSNLLYYIIEYEATGLNEPVNSERIKLFPNPTKDKLTIETNSTKEQCIEILNLIGQTIYTSNFNKKAKVNTSAYANGVYILKLSSDKETEVRKFIKQ